ncbi:MAG: PH domain-containing protein [Candidatus Anstonellales archaeon]
MAKMTVYMSPRKYIAIILLITFALFFMLAGVSLVFEMPFWLYAFVAIFAGISTIFAVFYARMTSLDIDEYGVVLQSGILIRNKTTIPFSRIDNIKTLRGIFDRLLGLGSLEIDTPGKAGAEVVIKSLTMNDIHKIEEIFRERVEKKLW